MWKQGKILELMIQINVALELISILIIKCAWLALTAASAAQIAIPAKFADLNLSSTPKPTTVLSIVEMERNSFISVMMETIETVMDVAVTAVLKLDTLAQAGHQMLLINAITRLPQEFQSLRPVKSDFQQVLS